MIIRFINNNCLDDNLLVEIVDNDKIYRYKDVKNYIKLCLLEGVYRLRLFNRFGYINTYSFIYRDNSEICICYNNCLRNIKFTLTDYYYNIPIERGDLFLWRKM